MGTNQAEAGLGARRGLPRRQATRYLLYGLLAGIVAPGGLWAYAMLRGRPLDPLEVLAVMLFGGALALGGAGWMIGRRDDVLMARNDDLRRLTTSLQELSVTDPLTGIANRRFLDELLAVEVARTNRYDTPLAVVMMDLDHFKELNDRFGHQAGDHALRHVAALLEAEKRVGDVVARYGGEEIVAVLPHTDAAAAAAWAERVRERLAAAAVVWQGAELAVTASFGLAAAPEHGLTAVELVERADTALYEAKRLGRNRTAVASPRAAA